MCLYVNGAGACPRKPPATRKDAGVERLNHRTCRRPNHAHDTDLSFVGPASRSTRGGGLEISPICMGTRRQSSIIRQIEGTNSVTSRRSVGNADAARAEWHDDRVAPTDGDEVSGIDAEETIPRYSLGVLFVHGIGEQRRGDALTQCAEPVFHALAGWAGSDSRPRSLTLEPAPFDESGNLAPEFRGDPTCCHQVGSGNTLSGPMAACRKLVSSACVRQGLNATATRRRSKPTHLHGGMFEAAASRVSRPDLRPPLRRCARGPRC